jgi:TonB family protein
MKFSLTVLLAIFPFVSFSQIDTTWLDVIWKVSSKDSAIYYRLITKNDGLWLKQDFFKENNQLQMSGNYIDSACLLKTGFFVWHRKDGSLADSILYKNNIKIEAWYFHENGKKSAYEVFENNKQIKNINWNENGIAIDENYRDTVYESKYATWKDYLEAALRMNQPKAYKKGKISGKLTVEFYIGKDGYIINARVIKSSGYLELDNHAIGIINNSPRWTPARQHGRKVISRKEQPFTYPPLYDLDY